jgi:transcriptional regulator GlxA family with amidase domain
MTKDRAESAPNASAQVEVGVVCDGGTSRAGIYGLTDLFTYAGDIAATRLSEGAAPPLRISHWQATDDDPHVRCIYDSSPGPPNAPTVLLIPGNAQAPLEVAGESPLIPWLRQKHGQGVVLAAVCGGVFILARTGLLAGRQATTHWAFSDQFAAQFPDVLTETDHMVIDYGDVVTGWGRARLGGPGLAANREVSRPYGHAGHGALHECRSAGTRTTLLQRLRAEDETR